MKRFPRQAKSAAKPVIDAYSEESESSEDETTPADFFTDISKQIKPEPEDSSESDFKDKGKKRKNASAGRRSASKKIKLNTRPDRQASPEIPIPLMSDDEHEDERADDVALFEKVKKPLRQGTSAAGIKLSSLPNIIQIQVLSAPATINLNLRDLIAAQAGNQAIDQDWDGRTLLGTSVEDSDNDSLEKRRATTPDTFAEMRANPKYACFLELEPGLRNRIYRQVLVKDKPVKFNPSPELSRSAAILRTCRRIYDEATGILYGENAFHLDRTDKTRGTLYTGWREVGYKDMRRFLETIGQGNLSKMRFLSISLSDAISAYSPELTTEQRRYYNDPVLHHIFRLIGASNAVFEKLVVNFGGRGSLGFCDVSFIRPFATMRCRSLIKICGWNHSRICDTLFVKMKNHMQVPTPDNVNPEKQRVPTMQHELSESRIYLGCRCNNRF